VKEPEVSIIIPVFNRAELTRQCLETTYRTAPDFCEIIVIDNGSTDETPAYLAGEAAAGRVTVIRSERNLGFARACNLGALKAQGRLLIFLNNDTIPTPGWVEAMVQAAARPGVGIVGARLLYPDGRIQHAGIVFRRGAPIHLHRFAPADAPAAGRRRDFDMVTAACMLIPRELFLKLGGFDETFLNGFEDVDLCLRVRSLGLRVVYEPEAVVYHLESQSSGRSEHDGSNLAEFLRRWRACFGRGGRLQRPAPPENLVAAKSLLLNPTEAPGPDTPRVIWQAPFFDRSGYADEARQFVLGLAGAGHPVRALPVHWSQSRVELPPDEALTLARLTRVLDPVGDGPAVGVFHALPELYRPAVGAHLHVIRTMFETDRIPEGWVGVLNRTHRVWVPGSFNVETFAASGVDPERLAVIPSPIDGARFSRGVEPLEIPGRRGFNFLSVLDFNLRKGWDILVRAFAETFGPDADVALILKVWSYRGLSPAEVRRRICELLGRDLPPNIILYFSDIPAQEMPRLYAAADAFVLPTRGEGFCRPAAEAMATGRPVIVTGWGGHRDFATPETAFLVDYRLVPVPEKAVKEVALYRGHRWAEPSAEHLKALMREVVERPDVARTRAEAGRRKVLGEFNREAVTRRVVAELEILKEAARSDRRRRRPAPPVLVWEGDFSSTHSFARVNRELTRALERAGVRVIPREPGGQAASAPAWPPLWVRHRWPPDFNPPPAGRFAVIQPWEYGSVPREWVEGLNRVGAELWVPSAFVRECFVEGGVPADRVHVVPNGVDPDRFHPGAAPAALGIPDRGFKFLFVGGTLWRKGIDLLLEAYRRAFRSTDDVVLVVKDVGVASFYRDGTLREKVKQLAASDGPPIVYIDRELPDEALPGLYTACHCLVHPFRGEGFALPVAEAMASGLPVIATGAGPVLEFADESTAYLIPARPVFLKTLAGGLPELVGRPWVFEPDLDALIDLLRWVYHHHDEARRKGEAAARRIRTAHTWDHAARGVLARLSEAGRRPVWAAGVAKTCPPEDADDGRPLISLCMVIKDGAKDLPRCLESVRGIADEVIVVDTGSADGTPEVARAFGAKVTFFPWTGSFAEARNESLRCARGQWVLVLDADEALGRGICETKVSQIRDFLTKTDADGFLLPQVTYLGPEPGSADAVVTPALRLFRNLPGLKFRRRLHEQILESLKELKPAARLGVLDVEIEHYGYLSINPRVGEKHRRNIELARQEIAENPTDAFGWFNLGQEYFAAGRWEGALFCFRRAIRYLPGEYRMWLPRAIELAAVAALKLGRPRGALALLREAAEGLGDHPNLRLLEGQARLALGDIEGARRSFEGCLAGGQAEAWTLEIRNEGAAGYGALYWLGICAEREGKLGEAVEAFARSLRLSLQTGRCYRPAVEALVRLLLPRASSGAEFLEALSRILGQPIAGPLAAAVGRAIFADLPVPPQGLEAAAHLAGAGETEIKGFLALFEGRYEEAAGLLGGLVGRVAVALSGRSRLEEFLPADRSAVGWVLGVLLQREEFDHFEALMPLVERLWPDEAERAVMLGRLYGRFGFWDLVVESLLPHVGDGSPHMAGEALGLLAAAFEARGDLDAAEALWLEAAAKSEDPILASRAYAALAAIRLARGRHTDTGRLLELAAQLASRNGSA